MIHTYKLQMQKIHYLNFSVDLKKKARVLQREYVCTAAALKTCFFITCVHNFCVCVHFHVPVRAYLCIIMCVCVSTIISSFFYIINTQ